MKSGPVQSQVERLNPGPGLHHFGLPAREHCGGSDPARGGLIARHCTRRLTLAGDAPAVKKGGVAPSTSTPLVLRAVPPDGRGTREAQPRFALPRWGREIRLIPRPMGRSQKVLNYNREEPPSARKASWLLNARATWTRHRGFLGGALVCLHVLDPQRRKSSIIPGSLCESVSCSDSSSRLRRTGSRPVFPNGWRRTSLRDWAAEETDHPREVIETALAHVVRNRVEAAYARSDLFERRRRLMGPGLLSGRRESRAGPIG